MNASRRGFTLIEVVVAIVIVGVLTGMLMTGLGLSRGLVAVDSAEKALIRANNRARMVAIERGTRARLRVSASQDRAWVVVEGDTVTSFDFGNELGVAVEGLPAELTVCFNSRGYADPSCNNFGTSATITLAAGAESSTITVLPLGQMSPS